MKYQLIFSLLAVALIFSCSPESTSTTEGGLNYDNYGGGDGATGTEGDFVSFHINYFADADEQFNSRDQGQESTVKLGEVGKGDIMSLAMEEVLSNASVGDSMALYIPTDSLRSLGFPETDTTKTLTYRMKITSIESQEEFDAKTSEAEAELEAKAAIIRERLPEVESFVAETYRYIASGKGGANIQSTESGLQYIIHEEGVGETLTVGELATVHYYGILKSNGEMFDNSWNRGQELSFPLGGGRVIRGWDEGVALLKPGAKATLIIPYNLGYGEAGSPPAIPTKSDLIFYIEVAAE